MRLFVFVLIAATIAGGLVGAELLNTAFSITGAVIGGVGAATGLLGLGAYFDAQDRKRAALSPEMRAVFDRMITGKNDPSPNDIKVAKQDIYKGIGATRPAGLGNQRLSTKTVDCLHALETVTQKLSPGKKDPRFYSIKHRVEKLIRRKDFEVHAKELLSDFTPTQFVLSMLGKECLDEISSGRHHLYRGVLAPQGQQLGQIYMAIVTELETTGLFDRAAAEERRAALHEVIRSFG